MSSILLGNRAVDGRKLAAVLLDVFALVLVAVVFGSKSELVTSTTPVAVFVGGDLE